MDEKHKRLLEVVDHDIQDYVELRLHSHTESSNKVLLDKLHDIEKAVNRYEKVLSDEKIQTLLDIIRKYQEQEIINKNNKKLGKIALWWAGALVAIGSAITLIIAGLKWIIINVILKP